MLKTTIWISRGRHGAAKDRATLWSGRPSFICGEFGTTEYSQQLMLCHFGIRRAEAWDGFPIPAPGELLRVEVSAEVVETIKGD